MPEAMVSIVIDGYKTTHQALERTLPAIAAWSCPTATCFGLVWPGASELKVEPVGSGGVAAIFDVSGLDRDALELVPVVR